MLQLQQKSQQPWCTSPLRFSQQEASTSLPSLGFMLPVQKSPRLSNNEVNWGMNLSHIPHWYFHSSPFLISSLSWSSFLFQLPIRIGMLEMRALHFTNKLKINFASQLKSSQCRSVLWSYSTCGRKNKIFCMVQTNQWQRKLTKSLITVKKYYLETMASILTWAVGAVGNRGYSGYLPFCHFIIIMLIHFYHTTKDTSIWEKIPPSRSGLKYLSWATLLGSGYKLWLGAFCSTSIPLLSLEYKSSENLFTDRKSFNSSASSEVLLQSIVWYPSGHSAPWQAGIVFAHQPVCCVAERLRLIWSGDRHAEMPATSSPGVPSSWYMLVVCAASWKTGCRQLMAV